MLMVPSTRGFVGAGAAPTLDATQLGAGVVLTDGGRTASMSTTNNWGNARGIKSNNSGIKYFEVILGSIEVESFAATSFGVATTGFDFINSTGGQIASGPSIALYRSGGIWTFLPDPDATVPAVASGAVAIGDVGMFMVNFNNGGVCDVWVGWKGIWSNRGFHSTTLDPSNPDTQFTGGFISGQLLYPGVSVERGSGASSIITLNTRGPFTYALPSGAVAWG